MPQQTICARPLTALSLLSRRGDFGTSTRGSFNYLSYIYPAARVRGIAERKRTYFNFTAKSLTKMGAAHFPRSL
jgi:hypothetical protein